MQYDLFISYSRKDNIINRVTELKEKIEIEYLEFTKEELKCFFDKEEIKGMDDWKQRLLQGLKDSHLLLLILSPNYLESSYCEWEIVEYLKYEYARATQGDGVAQIYFMEIPGLDGPGFAEKTKVWIEKVCRRQRFDFRPWYNEGADSLKETDVKNRLEELKISLSNRINRMRRIANASGNLAAPNARFVGREREMKLLHESVGFGKFGVLTAVHGMGGLGKTAIAFQYAYAYADFYPGGRWQIGCANETNLYAVLKKLDLDLKVTFTEDEKKDDKRGAMRIINELEALAIKGAEGRGTEKDPPKPAVLLLLDNVDHAKLIQPPFADLITGKEWLKVLVTTRMGPEELGTDDTKQTLLTIDELPFDDALSLIESYQPGGKFTNDDEKVKAGEIVKLLGGFTLAVEVASLYLYERKGQISCAAFLEMLIREGGVIGVEIAGTKTKTAINHNKVISATLAPTLDILSPEEILILRYASLLPPDIIPIPWLRTLVIKEYPKLGTEYVAGLDDPWLSTINHLLSLRFLQITVLDVDGLTPRIVRMHRIVQEIMQNRCTNNDELKMKLCDLGFDRSDYLEKHWHLKDEQWEINPLVTFTELLLISSHPLAPKMVKWLGQWLEYIYSYYTYRELHLKAIAQLKNNQSPEQTEIAILLSNLSVIEQMLGNLKEAKEILKEAIDIDEKYRASDHQFLGIRYGNLAIVELELGNLKEAKELINKSINIRKQIYEKENPDLASNFDLLGCIESELGNLKEAKELHIEAIAILEKLYEKDHPALATCYSNLACVEHALGNRKEAKELHIKAIAILEKVYEMDHPVFALYYSNLAVIEQDMRNLIEAESLFRKALAIREKSLPPSHPYIKTNINNLANLLEKIGRNEEAKELRIRSLEIEPKEMTPLDMRKRALEYFSLDDYSKAEELLYRVLAEKFELPGTYCHLVRIFIITNRLAEAKKHIEQAWVNLTVAPVYVIARILWFKIALADLEGKSDEKSLGQLKTVLQKEDAFMEWTMKHVLDHIKPQITEQQHAFLSSLVDGLSYKQNLAKLNDFKEWKDAKPEEID